MLQLIWNTIAYSGMAKVMDEAEQKNVLLINTLAVILILFTLAFTGISVLILPTELQLLPKIPLIYSVLLLGVLWLNGKGFRLVARLYFAIGGMAFMGGMNCHPPIGCQTLIVVGLVSTAVALSYM